MFEASSRIYDVYVKACSRMCLVNQFTRPLCNSLCNVNHDHKAKCSENVVGNFFN